MRLPGKSAVRRVWVRVVVVLLLLLSTGWVVVVVDVAVVGFSLLLVLCLGKLSKRLLSIGWGWRVAVAFLTRFLFLLSTVLLVTIDVFL